MSFNKCLVYIEGLSFCYFLGGFLFLLLLSTSSPSLPIFSCKFFYQSQSFKSFCLLISNIWVISVFTSVFFFWLWIVLSWFFIWFVIFFIGSQTLDLGRHWKLWYNVYFLKNAYCFLPGILGEQLIILIPTRIDLSRNWSIF